MSDEPVASYIAAAIPVDSIENYVVQMAPSESRPQTATALSLGEVIKNIPSAEGEAAIQQLKLNWWLEETELCEKGKPRHPLTRHLLETTDHQQWLQPLRLLVTHNFDEIGRQPFASLSDCLTFSHHGAEHQAVLAACLPDCDEQALAGARTAGVGIVLSRLLVPHAPDGALPLPPNAPPDLRPEKLTGIALEHLEKFESDSAAIGRDQLPLKLQARLHKLQLRRLQQCSFDSRKARVGTFSLLWQAWREARKLVA